ncbi:hypothetical protein Pcinc_028855 [Petrolisthes cinctipes]|uniref:Uncharacterized protein n=1 Tax=Petrolisthes cinctipes TaxID=88211 RepID=A0AAE1F180_PETCI|nr:hypothetical protein Pcinc_028855 [Petrolisthes cinctipes]
MVVDVTPFIWYPVESVVRGVDVTLAGVICSQLVSRLYKGPGAALLSISSLQRLPELTLKMKAVFVLLAVVGAAVAMPTPDAEAKADPALFYSSYPYSPYSPYSPLTYSIKTAGASASTVPLTYSSYPSFPLTYGLPYGLPYSHSFGYPYYGGLPLVVKPAETKDK